VRKYQDLIEPKKLTLNVSQILSAIASSTGGENEQQRREEQRREERKLKKLVVFVILFIYLFILKRENGFNKLASQKFSGEGCSQRSRVSFRLPYMWTPQLLLQHWEKGRPLSQSFMYIQSYSEDAHREGRVWTF
jgi:hypothetical protein